MLPEKVRAYLLGTLAGAHALFSVLVRDMTDSEADRRPNPDRFTIREALAHLGVKKGDVLFLTEAPDGYRITPYDPEFERQMKLAEEIMHDRREVFRALAK